MKKLFITATLYTLITALGLGVIYPLTITVIARVLLPKQASGQLIHNNGQLVGSALIGQPFTGERYFHSRPSSAGTGYDATASSGSNLGPTNKSLVDRINASQSTESNGTAVPIDLVTASGSGLDPDITPASALYQVHRIAQTRHLSEDAVIQLVQRNITPRQFGLLGEPRVNVLQLNRALDQLH